MHTFLCSLLSSTAASAGFEAAQNLFQGEGFQLMRLSQSASTQKQQTNKQFMMVCSTTLRGLQIKRPAISCETSFGTIVNWIWEVKHKSVQKVSPFIYLLAEINAKVGQLLIKRRKKQSLHLSAAACDSIEDVRNKAELLKPLERAEKNHFSNPKLHLVY